ncbi:hypothetical protein RYO59_002250 [Thermosynechococcaceae cyanobacterium Okahandja]
MPLPPLALPPSPAVRITGDVVVDPQAVLAPGVVLWAEAGASIRIAAGTCVGMGSVIHAHGGAIVIGEGVNLGAGVLLIGQVTIEPHACIGTTATIMNATVPAGAVVAAGSLMGDTSRRWQPEPQPTADSRQEAIPEPAVTTTNNGIPENPPAPTNETTTATKTGVVYGQTYVSQMFAKMFRTERLTNEPPE